MTAQGETYADIGEMEKSVIMRITCEDEDCGMASAYRMFSDGSFRQVINACTHFKHIPSRERIKAEIERQAATAQIMVAHAAALKAIEKAEGKNDPKTNARAY